jgi:hypothetical protein
MITLQNTTPEPDFIKLEDFNDISEIIRQEIKKQCKGCKNNLMKLMWKKKKILA